MSRISTHVLDTTMGKPAAGIAVRLEKKEHGAWAAVADGTTDADGRCKALAEEAEAGEYRLLFFTESYFSQRRRTSLYPEIIITFACDGGAHYHLPLLLSDNGYTTYRGS